MDGWQITMICLMCINLLLGVALHDTPKSGVKQKDMMALSNGLTKREYFAGLAMQGMLANRTLIDTDNWEWIAKNAAVQADELLKQLDNSPNTNQ